MLKSVFLVAAYLTFFPIQSAAEESPAIDFERLVNTGYKSMTSDQPPINVRNGSAWVKRQHTVSNLTFDVKKTDSLLNPTIGFVNFSVRIDESPLANSKEEATRATAFNESKFRYDVSLNYSYKDKAWQLKDSQVKHFFDGKFTFDSKPTELQIISEKFIVPLHYWMPRM